MSDLTLDGSVHKGCKNGDTLRPWTSASTGTVPESSSSLLFSIVVLYKTGCTECIFRGVSWPCSRRDNCSCGAQSPGLLRCLLFLHGPRSSARSPRPNEPAHCLLSSDLRGQRSESSPLSAGSSANQDTRAVFGTTKQDALWFKDG